ncbi:MAG: GUN4 domain-containing protein [Synechococcales cyanobacterium M58_A2018_015]|nr:GUN4 domain-containing protein [Synechococcales cyanobacterium M58_A2018_015]
MSATDNTASFRDRVQQRVQFKQGKLADADRDILLDRERFTYGLSKAEAEAILDEELRAYQPSAATPAASEAHLAPEPSPVPPSPDSTSTSTSNPAPISEAELHSAPESAAATNTESSAESTESDNESTESSEVPPTRPELPPAATAKDPQDTTTMRPSIPPDVYLANLQRYGAAYSRALDKGFLFDDDTKEELRRLAHDLELDPNDVTKTEQDILRQRFNPKASPPPAPPDPLPVKANAVQPPPPPQIPESYRNRLSELKKLLNKRPQWKQADEMTLELILSLLYHGKDEKDTELDPNVLVNFAAEPWQRAVMQELDKCWQAKGKFGFQRQLQIYQSIIQAPGREPSQDLALEEAIQFAKTVQWWKVPLPGFGFLKFYDRLNFTPQAPAGHLPAWWFWKTTKRNNFRLGGLSLLSQRGGCRMDTALLAAFMIFLKTCGFSAQPTAQPTKNLEMTQEEDDDAG